MANILILVATHICGGPRAQKEAETLSAAGHEVTVMGVWYDPELVERDRLFMADKKWRFEPVVDFRPITRWGRLKSFKVRLQKRAAHECYRQFGAFSAEVLGFQVNAMLKAARRVRADLTIVHAEGGLWIGSQLLDEGFNVGVDFEDWFSEDLLPQARADRPLAQLKALEGRLARDCTYSFTTSTALADALSAAYHAPRPRVLYNTFPWAERELIDGRRLDRHSPELPSLYWFSQNIGPGRGLETLFEALHHLNAEAEVHLRGNCSASARSWLEPLIPPKWRGRVFIHNTVPNAELLSRTAEHDIGLALETPYCSNKQFTASNKIFQYLLGGLAVVATNTAGQREVLSSVGQLVPPNNALALAQSLEDLIHNPAKLAAAKAAALQACESKFCWERQSDVLLQAAEISIRGGS